MSEPSSSAPCALAIHFGPVAQGFRLTGSERCGVAGQGEQPSPGLDLAALLTTDGLIHDSRDQARRTGKRRPLADAQLMAPLDLFFSEGDALAVLREELTPRQRRGTLVL